MIRSAVKELLSVPTPSCHASCTARVGDETWLVWFGGTQEGHRDVDIYFSRKTHSGWTSPIRVSAADDLPHWNPVLMPCLNGADLFFKVGLTIPQWQTMRVHLNPEGVPVSGISELVPGDVGGRGPVRNKCLTLRDGRILAPASIEAKEPGAWRDACCAGFIERMPEKDEPLRWKPMIDVSDDGGVSFSRVIPIPLLAADGQEHPGLAPAVTVQPADGRPLFPCRVQRQGAIQPTLWQSDDGSVHALMRSSEGCILRSDSPDGETWSTAACTGLPNNNSGIDLVRLNDGRIILCLNPVSGDWVERTPLWLYVSQDDGATFSPLMALETAPGQYSYPSLSCDDTTLFLSYSWNCEKIAVWTIELEPIA